MTGVYIGRYPDQWHLCAEIQKWAIEVNPDNIDSGDDTDWSDAWPPEWTISTTSWPDVWFRHQEDAQACMLKFGGKPAVQRGRQAVRNLYPQVPK